MASAMNAKIMETPPAENRSRSDIACLLAAVIFDAPGNGRVQRESRNAAQDAKIGQPGSARRAHGCPGTLGVSPPVEGLRTGADPVASRVELNVICSPGVPHTTIS